MAQYKLQVKQQQRRDEDTIQQLQVQLQQCQAQLQVSSCGQPLQYRQWLAQSPRTLRRAWLLGTRAAQDEKQSSQNLHGKLQQQQTKQVGHCTALPHLASAV